MKKKLIAAIITVTLLIAGCESANVSAEQDKMLTKVEYNGVYTVYADKDTGVMYLYVGYGRGFGAGLTVMLNADGTPKIWQGEE